MNNMTIHGKYNTDSNFTTVFSENAIYTIAHNSGDWGCVKVGKCLAVGGVLTQDIYNKWEAECTESGTFELGE